MGLRWKFTFINIPPEEQEQIERAVRNKLNEVAPIKRYLSMFWSQKPNIKTLTIEFEIVRRFDDKKIIEVYEIIHVDGKTCDNTNPPILFF